MMTLKLARTPPLVVAGWAVVCSPYTTHGWRPSSVTTQPRSIATTAASPLTAPAVQNSCGSGQRRRRHQVRDLDPTVDVPVDVHPGEPFRDVPGGLRDVFHGRELDRLVLRDRPRGGVTDEDLERGQHRGRDEPEREPV